MHINLTLSLYWLLVPAFLAIAGFVAYKTRDLGSGPGDAMYGCFIMGAGLFALLVFLVALMAYHLLTLFSL